MSTVVVGRSTSHSQLSSTYEHACEALIISRTPTSSDYPLGFLSLSDLSFCLSLPLALWLSWCKLTQPSQRPQIMHTTHTWRPVAMEERTRKRGKWGAKVSTYDVRLKSNLMTMSIIVCGRVRIYLPTYSERSGAFAAFHRLVCRRRPNFLTEGPLDRARSINMRVESTGERVRRE